MWRFEINKNLNDDLQIYLNQALFIKNKRTSLQPNMNTKAAKFLLSALLYCSSLFAQDTVAFKEETFWKGQISMIPHGLYRGSGLAPDGTFFLGDSGNLVKVNLPSGTKESIVKTPHSDEYAFASAVSPDSKQIAYSWFNGDGFDLMLVEKNIVEKRFSIPRLLVDAKKGATPYDWSPDGKWILVSLWDTSSTTNIALISPENGAVKILKNAGKTLFNKMSFSPDGKYITYDYSNDIYIMNADGTSDNRLFSDSSNKSGPYWSPDGKYIFYLSQDKDLYVVSVLDGKAKGTPQALKKNIDFFSPLGFIKDGSFLYGVSSPIQLDVYIAEIDPSTQKIVSPPKQLSYRFPGFNLDAVLSPNGSELAYKSGRAGGKEVIVVNIISTGEEHDVCEEHASIVQWFPDNVSLLLARNGDGGSITLYRINTESGKEDSLLELKSDYANNTGKYKPILSPDGKIIYYIESKWNLNTSAVFAFEMETRQERKLATLNSHDITSFSSSPDGKYLSMVVLYQGEKGRPSALQVVNLQTGEKNELFKNPWGDPTKFFGLGWSADARYIYYVRRDTATSSSFLWRIPVTGGEPQKTGLNMIDLRMPQVHPDGKHILFYGGKGWYNKTYEIKAITPVRVTPSSKQ